jgi:hypothetical protein
MGRVSGWVRRLIFNDDNVERTLELVQNLDYFRGNITLAGQTVVGGLSLLDGGYAIVEGLSTEINPIAKGFRITGGCLELLGGSCLVTCSCVTALAPPAALGVSTFGFCFNRWGKCLIARADDLSCSL